MTKKKITFNLNLVSASIYCILEKYCKDNKTRVIENADFLQVAQDIAEAVSVTPATIQDLVKGDYFRFNSVTYCVTRKYSNDDRPLLAIKEYDIFDKIEHEFHYEGLEIDKLLYKPLTPQKTESQSSF